MDIRCNFQIFNILWVDMKLTGQRTRLIHHWKQLSIAENRNVFTYETYVLIFDKNMRILYSNNEEMRDDREVQKFLSGI